jgi:hypothetical protein
VDAGLIDPQLLGNDRLILLGDATRRMLHRFHSAGGLLCHLKKSLRSAALDKEPSIRVATEVPGERKDETFLVVSRERHCD